MIKEELVNKYKDYPYRDEMTEAMELEFVNDWFDCYESEGFAKAFWSQGGDYPEYHGKSFKVMGRTPVYKEGNTGADLECLPMWKIRFEDGFEMDAYPDEIVPSEMRANGCPKEYLSVENDKET